MMLRIKHLFNNDDYEYDFFYLFLNHDCEKKNSFIYMYIIRNFHYSMYM